MSGCGNTRHPIRDVVASPSRLRRHGPLAQLVEQHVYTVKVVGSIPAGPTLVFGRVRVTRAWHTVPMSPRNTHLGQDEVQIAHLRTHPKRIFGPVLLGLVLLIAAAAGAMLLPPTVSPEMGPWVVGGIWIVAAILIIVIVVPSVLRWHTTTYIVTTRRIMTRRGILTRHGHDIPIRSISAVSTERSLSDRLFGCGTLMLATSAEQPVRLDDVPNVQSLEVQISELLAAPLQA